MKTYNWREAARRANRWTLQLALYGLTPESFAALIEGQGGRCASCAAVLRAIGRVCIDYDRERRLVRGVLCLPCLDGLRGLDWNMARARALADYLEQE